MSVWLDYSETPGGLFNAFVEEGEHRVWVFRNFSSRNHFKCSTWNNTIKYESGIMMAQKMSLVTVLENMEYALYLIFANEHSAVLAKTFFCLAVSISQIACLLLLAALTHSTWLQLFVYRNVFHEYRLWIEKTCSKLS